MNACFSSGALQDRVKSAVVFPGTVVLGCAVNMAAGRGLPEGLSGSTGKIVALRIADLGLELFFEIGHDGIRARTRWPSPDVVICASASDFLALARRQVDPDTLFFSRRLVMEGDTELGLIVRNMLDALPHPQLRDMMPMRLAAALRACLFG